MGTPASSTRGCPTGIRRHPFVPAAASRPSFCSLSQAADFCFCSSSSSVEGWTGAAVLQLLAWSRAAPGTGIGGGEETDHDGLLASRGSAPLAP